MKIRTSTREIEVASIIGETIKSGSHQYPAVKFVMPNGITAEDLAALSEGSFTIVEVNERGEEVEYVHEGYTSIREVSVTIAQINTVEQQIADLESQLAILRAEADATKDELESTKAEADAAKTELEEVKIAYSDAKAVLDTVDATNAILTKQNDDYKKEIEALEAENADLLFSNLTNSNLPATESTSN
jgi:chromosome segregation ATPase